ncbi:MAG: UV damage endonuclease UvsE [Richelia sp. RM2_1_2]|nr:UV damage endonuclease UvsE [Richelia sp. RM2_1_2]
MVQRMRIGFACKYIPPSLDKQEYRVHNFATTTVKWLKTHPDECESRLFEILRHNISAFANVLKQVASWPEMLRMMRIGSDLFPVYTHADFKWFWTNAYVQQYLATHLPPLGAFARLHRIRLSMHPGQFTVLNSITPLTVDRSIEEIEYHTDIARFLGYTGWHPDGFAINIHVGSRAGGVDSFRRNAHRLSADARNLLTIENDEMSFGVDDVLLLADEFAIVVDIHHNWCFTEGDFFQATDSRIQQVIDSWRGVRPKIHYSLSREGFLPVSGMPLYKELNKPKTKLRSHSEFCYNQDLNHWALTHLAWADIMVEAKMKNLASQQLYYTFITP